MSRFPSVLVFLSIVLAVGTGLLTASQASKERPELGITTTATVINVVDGDTVDVEIKRVVRVRLLDCWAPESKIDQRVERDKQAAEKAAGKASKANLERLTDGKTGTLHIPGSKRGRVADVLTMNRVLGIIWMDGHSKSLNEQQVESGFATTEKREELK